MQTPSATSHRAAVSCQGLLLTASLLTVWNQLTTAQVTIEPVPFNVAEGGDVLLQVHDEAANTAAYTWYKGNTLESTKEIIKYLTAGGINITGPAYSGRETIYSNGSLLFQKVTQVDTGIYTLAAINNNFQIQQASGEFHVHPVLPKPSITSNNSSPVEEKDSVTLTCEPETENTTYQWWMSDQALQEGDRLKLSNDSRILTLFSVTRNDTGPYVCETRNLVSGNRSDPLALNVYYGPDVPIILPPESYFHPGTSLNLSCQAASNPPAQYSWFLNGNQLQETQELSLPSITANDSGSYTCSVFNPDTGLSRNLTKTVTVIEPVSPPSIQASNTTVTEEDAVVLTCFSNDTGISIRWICDNQPLRLTDRMTLSQDNSTLSIDPVRREDAGEYQCEVFNLGSSRRSAAIRLEVKYDPTNNSGLSGGAIIGIVVGVVAGVALIGALAYFLFRRKTGGANDQHDLRENKSSFSNHSLDPSDTSPNKVDEVAYSSLNFSTLQPKQSTSDFSSKITETVYTEVKKK